MPDIDKIVHGAEQLTALGADGFVLFSILVVGMMFFLLISVVVFIYKSSQKQHESNEKRIEELTLRIVQTEEKARTNSQLNKECQTRLSRAIQKLENCIERLMELKK